MRQYVTRRLLLIIPTLLFVSFLAFAFIRFLPGDVVDAMVEEQKYAATAQEMRHLLGLDRPIYIQYFDWMWNLLQGKLGESLWHGISNRYMLALKIPVTLELGFMALAISVLIAIPLGVFSAIRQDTFMDYFTRSLAYLFHSIPYFWIGTLVIVYPSVYLKWAPPMQYTPLWDKPLQNLSQFAIPAAILGVYGASSIVRLTRAMMLEVLRQDYVRTAWAKGLRERLVLYRHALKNAMIPVISFIGLRVPVMLSGTVIMENLFGLPGVGAWMIESLDMRDYPIIQIGVVWFTLVVVATNLVVDLSYGWLDPRVRYQ